MKQIFLTIYSDKFFYRSLVLIFLFGCSFNTNIKAQQFSRLSPPVIFEGEEVRFPFVGGLNIPQTYNIDLNNDDIDDLILLDREGGVAIPYLRINNEEGIENLIYAPSYQAAFDGVRQWFVIRDYNGDGVEDIFCFPSNNLPGIEVRKGSYVDNKITFEKVPFNDDPSKPDILLYPSFSGLVNIYVGSNDQPEIIDVDQDGDMDILTFDVGGSYMNYYKNYALEDGFPLDTFSFKLEQDCWGNFYEQDMSEELLLSGDIDTCAHFFTSGPVISNRHSGSTVTAFDGDGDGDLDMIIGDLASSRLAYLDNQGNADKAWIRDQDNSFPSYDVSVQMDLFNAAFYTDINNDAKRDLVVSPNSTSVIENHNSVWFYNNVGTDDAPVFEYVQEDLFISDMLDFGSETVPQFTDVNQDGLVDLVIGTRGEYNGTGTTTTRLILFENTGSISQPKFELKEQDFAGYAQYAATALILSPCFGDLDGDGDNDMIVADNNGDLYYSENEAGPGQPYQFAQAIYKFMGIRPGNKVRPSIMDLNGDGLGDIITGQKKNVDNGQGVIGGLTYFENIGSVSNPQFEGNKNESPNILAFGGVNAQVIGFSESYAAPALYDMGDDFLLVTGSVSGRLNAYEGIKNNLNGIFDKRYEDWGRVREGELSTVSIADINADNILDLIVGNTRGGLSLFQSNLTLNGEVSTFDIIAEMDLRISPNPASDFISVKHNAEDLMDSYRLKIFDINGRLIRNQRCYHSPEISISNLESGLYVARIETDLGSASLKFVKL